MIRRVDELEKTGATVAKRRMDDVHLLLGFHSVQPLANGIQIIVENYKTFSLVGDVNCFVPSLSF